jgi:hypothetical protein
MNCILDYRKTMAQFAERKGQTFEARDLQAALEPEYVFSAGNEQGTDVKEVMRIRPGIVEIEGRHESALALEGVRYPASDGTPRLEPVETVAAIQERLATEFKRPVFEILAERDEEQGDRLQTVFDRRRLSSQKIQAFTSLEELYRQLDPQIQEVLTQSAFLEAFSCFSEVEMPAVLARLNEDLLEREFTFLELPVHAALAINAAFTGPPDYRMLQQPG